MTSKTNKPLSKSVIQLIITTLSVLIFTACNNGGGGSSNKANTTVQAIDADGFCSEAFQNAYNEIISALTNIQKVNSKAYATKEEVHQGLTDLNNACKNFYPLFENVICDANFGGNIKSFESNSLKKPCESAQTYIDEVNK